jgi:hypothetical protein
MYKQLLLYRLNRSLANDGDGVTGAARCQLNPFFAIVNIYVLCAATYKDCHTEKCCQDKLHFELKHGLF